LFFFRNGSNESVEGYLLIFDFRKLKGDAGKVEETIVTLEEKEKNIKGKK
jgi:hypothetical protein